jgi:hypothetical protein
MITEVATFLKPCAFGAPQAADTDATAFNGSICA